ncbi:tetratricopeptide repeat protein [Myxococcota bacterium]|nr:tetratricopeptide repeat protein [Myxococcota bacterium]
MRPLGAAKTFSGPELHLIHLLDAHFVASEVITILAELPEQEELAAHVSTIPSSGSFSAYVVTALALRGLVDRPLFERLAATRPSKIGPIWGVAARFGFAHPDAGPVDPLPGECDEEEYAEFVEAGLRLDARVGHQEHGYVLCDVLISQTRPLRGVRVCYLVGVPGVGKSLLVEGHWFANLDELPGGPLKITLGEGESPTEDALLLELAARLGVRQSARPLEDDVAEAALALGPMIHLEDLRSEAQARAVLGLVGRLPQVPILISGRHTFNTVPPGWRVLPVEPLTVSEALGQLVVELRPEVARGLPVTTRRALVSALGGLPLAIHLAASLLNEGGDAQRLLEALAASDTASDTVDLHPTQRALGVVFDQAMAALRVALGEEADVGARGVAALGFAPPVGLRRPWLEAVVGASPDTVSRWFDLAARLSIVQVDELRGRWRVPNALGELLRAQHSPEERDAVLARMDGWALSHMSAAPLETRGARWQTLQPEHEALAEWAARLHGPRALSACLQGFEHIWSCGPDGLWLLTHQRGLIGATDDQTRSILLHQLGRLSLRVGQLDLAQAYAAQKTTLDRAQGWHAGVLDALALHAEHAVALGRPKDALKVYRDELLPAFARRDDRLSAFRTELRIAELRLAQGALNHARRILCEELLPALDRLGDLPLKAATLGALADVVEALGDRHEAQRLRREEVLPVLVQLGDALGAARTMNMLADALQTDGEIDEAERLRRSEVLPVLIRAGDVRARAHGRGRFSGASPAQQALVASGRPAELLKPPPKPPLLLRPFMARPWLWRAFLAVLTRFSGRFAARRRASEHHQRALTLKDQGAFDEALRIWRQEVLPVYGSPDDAHPRANVLTHVADVLCAQGQHDEALQLLRGEVLPLFERAGDPRGCANVMLQIADVFTAQGRPDCAITLLEEEVLPTYERLGDERSKAVTMGRIAENLQTRGFLDEALEIWRDVELPIFERLGDEVERAKILGMIAGLYGVRGQVDEALGIWREDVLPALVAAGARREVCRAQANVAALLIERGRPEDLPEARALLLAAEATALELNLSTELQSLRGWFSKVGLPT